MVTLLWIAFDVAISVRMAFVSPQYGIPIWECVAWGAVGLILGVVAYVSEHREHLRNETRMIELRNQMMELRNQIATGQAYHSGQLSILGQSTSHLFETVNRQFKSEPQDSRAGELKKEINAVRDQIKLVEKSQSPFDAFLWKPMTPEQRDWLVPRLKELGPHSVGVIAHENIDCVQLGYSLKEAFELAHWSAQHIPIAPTHDWKVSDSGGISIRVHGTRDLLTNLMKDVSTAIGVSTLSGSHIDEQRFPEVWITIGPRWNVFHIDTEKRVAIVQYPS